MKKKTIFLTANKIAFRKKAKELLKNKYHNIKHISIIEFEKENGYAVFAYGINLSSLKPCGILLSYNGEEKIKKHKHIPQNLVEVEVEIK